MYKAQGETFNTEYTIHEWNRFDTRMKYTAISRATSKSLINIIDNDLKEESTRDTDNTRLTRRLAEEARLKCPLYRRRREALSVLSRIIHNVNTSYEYLLKHTQLTRTNLLQHLDIINGIPKGYEIDHIRPRREHSTEKDFKDINAYWNLRLLSKKDNIAMSSDR